MNSTSKNYKKLSFFFLARISPGQMRYWARQKSKFNKDVSPTASFNIATEREVELSRKLCSFIKRELLINRNEEFFF